MKAPPQIDKLSLADIGSRCIYPPLGFLPVWDAELGNGDLFGLYWPYGREAEEPIVCDMVHDAWALQYAFSSVGVFLEWLAANDFDRGDVDVDDPDLAPRRFEEARAQLHGEPDAAISLLRNICESFPESAEYWYALATQLRRIGDEEGAARAAVRSFASNWAFGMPPPGTMRLLQNAQGTHSDPVIERCGGLTLQFGGVKENPEYEVIRECVDSYLSSPTPVIGLLLNQNYAYGMLMETTSFQDRYGFDPETWSEDHRKKCLYYLGDSRTEVR